MPERIRATIDVVTTGTPDQLDEYCAQLVEVMSVAAAEVGVVESTSVRVIGPTGAVVQPVTGTGGRGDDDDGEVGSATPAPATPAAATATGRVRGHWEDGTFVIDDPLPTMDEPEPGPDEEPDVTPVAETVQEWVESLIEETDEEREIRIMLGGAQ